MPEAAFRLADMLAVRRRYGEARAVIEAFREQVPDCYFIRDYLTAIDDAEKDNTRRQELEEQVNPENVMLAYVEQARGKSEPALEAFRRAVGIGGDDARKLLQCDWRTQSLRKNPEFEALLQAGR